MTPLPLRFVHLCQVSSWSILPSHTPDHIPAYWLFPFRDLLEEVHSIMKLSFAFLIQPSPYKDTNSGSGWARGWEFEGQEEIRPISTLYPDSALLMLHITFALLWQISSSFPVMFSLGHLCFSLHIDFPCSPPSHIYQTSLHVSMRKLLRHGKNESLQ